MSLQTDRQFYHSLGPSHQNLKPILLGDHLNGYQIQFNPTEVGDHAIDVKIGGNSIPGCPFLVKVYDAKMVKVTDIPSDGFVGQSIYFTSTSLFFVPYPWLMVSFSCSRREYGRSWKFGNNRLLQWS